MKDNETLTMLDSLAADKQQDAAQRISLPTDIIHLFMTYQTPGQMLKWIDYAKDTKDFRLLTLLWDESYWEESVRRFFPEDAVKRFIQSVQEHSPNKIEWLEIFRQMYKRYLKWNSYYSSLAYRQSSFGEHISQLFSNTIDAGEEDTEELLSLLEKIWKEVPQLYSLSADPTDLATPEGFKTFFISVLNDTSDKFGRNIFTCARLNSNQVFLNLVYDFVKSKLLGGVPDDSNNNACENRVEVIAETALRQQTHMMLLCRQYGALQRFLCDKNLHPNLRDALLTNLMQTVMRYNLLEEAKFLITVAGKELLFSLSFPPPNAKSLCQNFVESDHLSGSVELMQLFVGTEDERIVAERPEQNGMQSLDEEQPDKNIKYVSEQELGYLIRGGIGIALKDAIGCREFFTPYKNSYNQMICIFFKLIRLFSDVQLRKCGLDPITLAKASVIVAANSSLDNSRQDAMTYLKKLFKSFPNLLVEPTYVPILEQQKTLFDYLVTDLELTVSDLITKELIVQGHKKEPDEMSEIDRNSEYSFGDDNAKDDNTRCDLAGAPVASEAINYLRACVEQIIWMYFDEEKKYHWGPVSGFAEPNQLFELHLSVVTLLELYVTLLPADSDASLATKLFQKVILFYGKEDILSSDYYDKKCVVKIIVRQKNLLFLKEVSVLILNTVCASPNGIYKHLFRNFVQQVIGSYEPEKISCVLDVLLEKGKTLKNRQAPAGLVMTVVTYLQQLQNAYEQALSNRYYENVAVLQKNLERYAAQIECVARPDNLNGFFASSPVQVFSVDTHENNTEEEHIFPSERFNFASR